jgi:hypothetical protein
MGKKSFIFLHLVKNHLITRTANEKPCEQNEEFSKCDDFSGEISSAHKKGESRTLSMSNPKKILLF